jgi:hypothetical protein
MNPFLGWDRLVLWLRVWLGMGPRLVPVRVKVSRRLTR